MSRARQIGQTVLLVILWVIATVIVCTLLGCEGLQKQEGEVRSIHIQADFKNDTIDVQLNQDQQKDKQKVKVKQ